MAQIQGKQLADNAITTAKIAPNAVTSAKVDSSVIIAAGTNPLTADWAVGSHKITGLLDPTLAQDAATKAYVDARVQGLDIHPSVRAATTANITLSGAQTIDGVSVIAGNRVLVKNQTTGSENGIYDAAAGAWTRSTDADTSAEVTAGAFTFVEEGTANADTGWVLSTDNPITLGTTFLTFVQFSSAGVVLAGAGLLKTGNTIDLVIEGTSGGLTANADNLQVNYGTTAELADVDAAAESAGTSQLIARADHKHSIATATAVNVGTANAAGTSTSLSRADHVHASPKPTTSNKNMTASVTTTDGSLATATTVVNPDALGGYIGVQVNGVNYLVGDGTKVAVDCYFSADGGTTARAMSAVIAGDSLYWNGSIAGFQLDATDRINLQMIAF